MVTEYRKSVKFFLTPGGLSDNSAYRLNDFDLPEGTNITGDEA